ncbi:MAG: deoxyguanosinetriphosphate triphosphohydrolase [Sphingomonadales bacterium]|nr:deoxyguanosinetriphosphate triphosphohydrolase [Sphingomonadales bacterium]
MSTNQLNLASYASFAQNSRGRLFDEATSSSRSPFQRDRDRIIHCGTFRRLKHKTQVFVYHEGDYYRTRLTHSIEVSQIARSISRTLRIDEDLAEALALAHDFGHTPFGHAGEEALDAAMSEYGGFDHNAQSLRLVTKLEQRYAAFDGLNLTWETLEGLAKHNGPLWNEAIDSKNPPESLAFAFRDYLPKNDLEIHTFASLEAQVAANSDDIAYNNHDIEDGLRAKLFDMAALAKVPFVGEIVAEVNNTYSNIAPDIMVHEVVRRLINSMVVDLVSETEKNLKKYNIKTVDDVRNAGAPMVAFSDAMKANDKELKAFLFENMYRHKKVSKMTEHGKKVVTELYNLYMQKPEAMPDDWRDKTDGPHCHKTARVVADFIAGMTDKFALEQFDKLNEEELK